MNLRPRLLAGLFAAALLSTATGVPEADADDECVITGFSPRSAVVGSTPVVTSAGITTAGSCSSFEQWSVDVGGVFSTTSEDGGFVYLSPRENSLAGRHDVDASLRENSADGVPAGVVQHWADGFSLRRATGWWYFDASPEPVAKGMELTLEGQLFAADWDSQEDVGLDGATVRVEFKTASGSWRPVKTVQTDQAGYVSTSVTAEASGTWRLRYLGDSAFGPASTWADSVKVVPPTACSGVAKCRVVKSIDVDGDGRKDSVGVVATGLNGENGKIMVRVRRATGQAVQTTSKKVHWFANPFIGAAPVDGARGAEILVGDQMGAHYEQFRMITYRKGKLITAPAPRKAGISNKSSRWGIDSSLSSNIGLYRTTSKNVAKLTVKTAVPADANFHRYTGKTKVYPWKKGKWVLQSSKTKQYTAKQTSGIGGLHIRGLPRYGE